MNIYNRFKRFAPLLFLIVAIISQMTGPASAGTVVVKPGQFDHFTIQLPEKAVAGENFIIKVQAYDLNNNLITNFIESGKEFRIDAGGSAVVQPSTLNASSFSGGTANISINSKKAEKIVFSIREAGGTVPVISRELMVVPNKLEHFIVQAPSNVRAGARFDVRIIARDLFDNTVDDVEIGRNLKITSSGTATPGMLGGTVIDFKNGTAMVTFVSEKSGSSFIELQELISGSRGRSNEIAVTPSVLNYFRLQAPKTAVAGEPFDLIVSAYDAYDNLITNYASSGAPASIMTTGSTKLEPTSLAPSDFKNGQAVVKAFYEKAEDIAIIVKDSNSDKSGKTSDIQVSSAAPDHFVVITPDTAISGQRFKVKIEAYDRFNNLVRNYNLAGNEVLLSTSGSSYITPSVVLPNEFINGVSVVEVMYDRAESFTISAKMIGDKRPGKVVTVSEKEPPREPAMQKREKPVVDKTPAVQPPVAEKKVQKPGEKLPAEKKSEPIKKETAAKKEEKKPVEKAQKERVEKPVQKPAEQKQEKPKKPEVKQPEKTVEPSKPVELAKKEEKKQDALTAVSKIAAIEAKGKAMLVINLSDVQAQFEYKDSVESKSGKEWLKLALKPAVRKTEKSFKFKSSFIGDVLVDEDKSVQNALNIYIELLPTGVTFDIERIKNTLIVTLSRP